MANDVNVLRDHVRNVLVESYSDAGKLRRFLETAPSIGSKAREELPESSHLIGLAQCGAKMATSTREVLLAFLEDLQEQRPRRQAVIEEIRELSGRIAWVTRSVAQRVPPKIAAPVPVLPNGFIRLSTIDEIVASLLGGADLVGVTGPPGIGKATAGLAVAHHEGLRERFGDRVLWVGAGIDGGVEGILRQIAIILGVDAHRNVTNRSDLIGILATDFLRVLAGYPTLVIVDKACGAIEELVKFVQSVEPLAAVISDQNSVRLRSVIPRGHVFEIPPLSEEDALRLLACHLGSPGEGDNLAPKCAEFVRLIDYWPGAIVVTAFLANELGSLWSWADACDHLRRGNISSFAIPGVPKTLSKLVAGALEQLSLGQRHALRLMAGAPAGWLGMEQIRPLWNDEDAGPLAISLAGLGLLKRQSDHFALPGLIRASIRTGTRASELLCEALGRLSPTTPPAVAAMVWEDQSAFEELLKDPDEVEKVGPGGATPIYHAVAQRNQTAFDAFVAAGARLDSLDEEGFSLLHLASQVGNEYAASKLLAFGADPRAENNSQRTAIDVAAYWGRAPILRLLLDEAALRSNAGAWHAWAAELGAKKGHEDVMRMLVEAHRTNRPPGDGSLGDALVAAVDAGHANIVRLLLDSGEDPNRLGQGYPPLNWAVQSGYNDIANLLIDAGAEIHTRDHRGVSPLDIAVARGHVQCVKLLLDAGCDPNDASGGVPAPILLALLTAGPLLSQKNRISMNERGLEATSVTMFVAEDTIVVRYLLEHGANPNSRDKAGDTALHLASKLMLAGHVDLLIAKGGDPSARNSDGLTARELVENIETSTHGLLAESLKTTVLRALTPDL